MFVTEAHNWDKATALLSLPKGGLAAPRLSFPKDGYSTMPTLADQSSCEKKTIKTLVFFSQDFIMPLFHHTLEYSLSQHFTKTSVIQETCHLAEGIPTLSSHPGIVFRVVKVWWTFFDWEMLRDLFSEMISQLVENWWFGLVVWIPGIPENETDCYLGVPRSESETTGPQTTNLPLVEIFKLIKHYCICLRLSLKDFGNNILRRTGTYPLVVGKISVLLQSVGCVRVYIYTKSMAKIPFSKSPRQILVLCKGVLDQKAAKLELGYGTLNQ